MTSNVLGQLGTGCSYCVMELLYKSGRHSIELATRVPKRCRTGTHALLCYLPMASATGVHRIAVPLTQCTRVP